MKHKVSFTLIDQLSRDLELNLDKIAKNRLLLYSKLMIQGLEMQRLTGEKTVEGFVEKQIYDSLYPLKLISLPENGWMLDLGSGGGLPGVPIKICRPLMPVTLADANRRKVLFLKHITEKLGLTRINFLNERAEIIGQTDEHRESHDIVLCRAVAQTAVLAELALPLLKLGGKLIIYKGPRGAQEAKEADSAIKICGGQIEKVHEYKLKTGEKRLLYLIRKAEKTPHQYPRSVGRPGKKPLRG